MYSYWLQGKQSPVPCPSGMAFPMHMIGKYLALVAYVMGWQLFWNAICGRRVEIVDEVMGLESLFGKFGDVIQGLTTEAELLVWEIRKLKSIAEEREAFADTLTKPK